MINTLVYLLNRLKKQDIMSIKFKLLLFLLVPIAIASSNLHEYYVKIADPSLRAFYPKIIS